MCNNVPSGRPSSTARACTTSRRRSKHAPKFELRTEPSGTSRELPRTSVAGAAFLRASATASAVATANWRR